MYRIVTKEYLNPTVVKMAVEAPFVAKKAEPGQFIILRTDENGFKFAYIGQARKSILQRLASHLVGFNQHIDLSLRKHKLYSEDNPYTSQVILNAIEDALKKAEVTD